MLHLSAILFPLCIVKNLKKQDMGSSKITHLSFFLCSLFLFVQCVQTEHGDDRNKNYLRSSVELHDKSSHSGTEPELNVFFHYKDLKVGNKMPIYFPTKDPSTSPPLLSRQESESIPFLSSQIDLILDRLSFPHGSRQAEAMRETLHHCEFPPLKGETKFCATSLESMLDSIGQIFGPESKLRVLTTNHLSEPIPLVQNYTVSEPPRVVLARKVVACHLLPYPYAVFYCHSQDGDNELYRVRLAGDDGGRVEGAAMCHMDTSQWDPNHVAFRVLETGPGASPVCHFFPSDNLIWLPA